MSKLPDKYKRKDYSGIAFFGIPVSDLDRADLLSVIAHLAQELKEARESMFQRH